MFCPPSLFFEAQVKTFVTINVVTNTTLSEVKVVTTTT